MKRKTKEAVFYATAGIAINLAAIGGWLLYFVANS